MLTGRGPFKSKDLDMLTKIRQQIRDVQQTEQKAANPAAQLKSWYEVDEQKNPNALVYAIVGFIVHCAFKGIVFMIFLFRGMFTTLFNGLVLNEMMVVFVVLDFWLTKNFNGKRMLGIKWYFDVDGYGSEKFFYECRANDKYLSAIWSKLFWVIQIVYSVIPFLFMILGLIRALFILINLELIIASIGIMIAGGANIFFFTQAAAAAFVKQKQIKMRLTPQELEDIQFATIVSYV